MKYAQPLQSEFYDRDNIGKSKLASTADKKNLYVKQYPRFFHREDVHRDFVAIQRELSDILPYARVIKEDIDTSFAHLQFDVAPADEGLLLKLLAKRGFTQA